MSELDSQFSALEKRIRDSVVRVAKDCADEIVDTLMTPETRGGRMNPLASPVYGGSYILSHRVEVNHADTSYTDRQERPLSQGEAETLVKNNHLETYQETTKFKLGDKIVISNNVRHDPPIKMPPYTVGDYAGLLEAGPSPWRKTPGRIYENARDLAVRIMLESGKKESVAKVNKRSARTHKIEVKL